MLKIFFLQGSGKRWETIIIYCHFIIFNIHFSDREKKDQGYMYLCVFLYIIFYMHKLYLNIQYSK